MSSRKPSPFVPQLCHLENREVPAVIATQLTSGILSVVTDSSANSVLVSQNTVNVTVFDIVTNRSWSYASSQVGRVNMYGGTGNDAFTSQGPAAARLVRMFGGQGNDTLTALGKGRVILNGGAGNDTLKGGGGNDQLTGGKGNDWIDGGAGDDKLLGNDGDDWLKGGLGIDSIDGAAGNNTVVSIDGASTDAITTGVGIDYIWQDQTQGGTDTITGPTAADFINSVDQFANPGADLTLDGDRIADPTPLIGNHYERFDNRPLFSTAGPQLTDIQQGQLGDCWMLAGLGSAALSNPDAIKSRVVDFGDGTYGVHLGNFFYRVDNDLVVDQQGDQRLNYVSLGKGGSVWASVMEKAYAFFRVQGANSFPSIEGGFSYDVFLQAFLTNPAQTKQLFFNEMNSTTTPQQLSDEFIAMMQRDPVTGRLLNAPTLGIDAADPSVPVLTAHQYVVYSINVFPGTTGSGGFGPEVTSVTLYNPWGIDGVPNPNDSNPNDGFVTLDFAQIALGIAGSLEYAPVAGA